MDYTNIIEKNPDLNQIAIVGIRTRGEIIARRITDAISKITNTKIHNGTVDVTFYRGDFRDNFDSPKVGPSDIKFDVSGKNIILIDDARHLGSNNYPTLEEIKNLFKQTALVVRNDHDIVRIST